MVQEYERAVIFRIGRLLPGGAKGPGMTRYSAVLVLILRCACACIEYRPLQRLDFNPAGI